MFIKLVIVYNRMFYLLCIMNVLLPFPCYYLISSCIPFNPKIPERGELFKDVLNNYLNVRTRFRHRVS